MFILRSVYDHPPSPTNLCGKPATQENFIASSKKALTKRRCRWRHDTVLAVITSELNDEAKKIRPKLGATADWELRAGFRRRLIFPQNITVTSLRPDLVIRSKSTRNVIMFELVPWKERLVEAFERQLSKLWLEG